MDRQSRGMDQRLGTCARRIFRWVIVLLLVTPGAAFPAPYELPSDDPDQPANLHQSLYTPVRQRLQQRAKERRDHSSEKAVARKQLPAPTVPTLGEVDQQLRNERGPLAPVSKRGTVHKDFLQNREAVEALPPAAAPAEETVVSPGSGGNKVLPVRRRLLLQLAAPPTALQLQNLRERGFRIEFVRENYVQGLANDNTLTALTELPFIRFISPVVPVQAHSSPAPSIGKQPASLLELETLHRQGILGQGVRIAVIDLGFDAGHPSLRANVAGSRSLRLDRDITGAGQWRHGTATAEVVTAVAPRASLFLLNFDPDSVFGYLQAIEEAVRDWHVQVVILAVNFPTPYDFYNGRGVLARALDAYARRGVLFVTAAGNNALRHYADRYRDPHGLGQHEFAGRDAWYFTLPAGQRADLYLAWDDEWNDHLYRLGLFVFDERRQVVAYSNARQGHPVQFCTLEAGESNQTLAVVVSGHLTYRREPNNPRSDLIPGRGPRFHLFVYAEGVSRVMPVVPESSLDPNFPTSEAALTVGAVQAQALNRIEPFSSRGRTSDARAKPDLVAPSGLKTSALGTFSGTSAAAPFVAGTAALILGRHPGLKPDQIKILLRRTARDLGPTGWDISYGAGLVDPLAAVGR